MTSQEEAMSGLISDSEFADYQKSKETTEEGTSRDRVRKRLKTDSGLETESDGDLLQSAGERTETDEYTTESSVQRKRKRMDRHTEAQIRE